MAGIVRIHINSDWQEPRLEMSRNLELAADKLYIDVFKALNMPVKENVEIINCTKEEAVARYDWQEGIDLLLYFENGTKATMQEKYLKSRFSTATFTEHQKTKPGAWYTCTAQYYFVGYARKYDEGINIFQDWILLDLPVLHRLDAAGNLPWKFKDNNGDYSGIVFRYLYFNEIPTQAIVARCIIQLPLF